MTSPEIPDAAENTDRELWRETEGDAYADSIHVTKGGGIGINCGGMVYVKPIREWHRLASSQSPGEIPDAAVEALLPCPFCGGEAERVDIEDGDNAGGSCICCKQCFASSNVEFEFKENFVSNWNRRAALPHLAAGRAEAAAETEPVAWLPVMVDRSREDPTPEETGEYETVCAVGVYYIDMYFGSDSYGWRVTLNGADDIADKDDPDAAKAAAQADYEQRIRSALVSAPAAPSDAPCGNAARYDRGECDFPECGCEVCISPVFVPAVPAAPAAPSETHDDEDRCIACDKPFKPGDRVLNDVSGGSIHIECCGPDRESYVGPGDPLPKGYVWQPAPAAEAEPVAWPSGFFALSGDARLRDCATEGCGQHVSIRVERDGVGSEHCEPCARKIAATLAAPSPSQEALREAIRPFIDKAFELSGYDDEFYASVQLRHIRRLAALAQSAPVKGGE